MRSVRLAVLLTLLVALTACDGPSSDATGREIYLETCARCHAPDLSGGVGPALGEGTNAAEQTDDYLVTTISDGRGRMPSFRQTLSAEQIDRVVGYLRDEQGQS